MICPSIGAPATPKPAAMAADSPQPPAFLSKLLISAAAASVAETATFPLDLLKTRLQLAGQQAGQQAAAATGARPAGLVTTAASVVRTEGMHGLYAGLAPAVLRHVPYTGIRVLAFEQLRGLAQRRLLPAGDGSAHAQLPLPVSLAIGLTAGGVAQLVAVPADLVKVRMQADGRLVAAGILSAPRWVLQRHARGHIWGAAKHQAPTLPGSFALTLRRAALPRL